MYIGPRPILPGQNLNEYINPYKGVSGSIGKYSFYPLWSTSHLLDGMPIHKHLPGEGRHPHDITLSRWFRGLQNNQELKNPGKGTRLTNFRTRPLEYHGLTATRALGGTFGHHDRDYLTYAEYSNWIYDGLAAAEALKTPGHHLRLLGAAGAPATFGRTNPLNPGQNAVVKAITNPGHHLPAGHSGAYGHNRTQEWFGVAAAKAL